MSGVCLAFSYSTAFYRAQFRLPAQSGRQLERKQMLKANISSVLPRDGASLGSIMATIAKWRRPAQSRFVGDAI